MSSTRNFKSPGIFAEVATTTIPPNPVQGVAYRDAAAGTADIGNGWPYGQRVDSKDWNQIMFLLTSMIGEIDKKGVIGWSDEVDYTEESVTFGSDGQLYRWLQESGPGTGAGVQDPVSAPTYWSLLNQSGFTQSLTGDGWCQLPNGLILQWGASIGTGNRGVTFPLTFPSAVLSIAVNVTESGSEYAFCQALNPTASGFTAQAYGNLVGSAPITAGFSNTVYYIAIGY